jgi:hypothetical protein
VIVVFTTLWNGNSPKKEKLPEVRKKTMNKKILHNKEDFIFWKNNTKFNKCDWRMLSCSSTPEIYPCVMIWAECENILFPTHESGSNFASKKTRCTAFVYLDDFKDKDHE